MAKCTWVGQSELAYYNSGEAAKIVADFPEKVDRFLYLLTSFWSPDMWSDAAIMRRRWTCTQSAFPLPNPNACSSYLYLFVRAPTSRRIGDSRSDSVSRRREAHARPVRHFTLMRLPFSNQACTSILKVQMIFQIRRWRANRRKSTVARDKNESLNLLKQSSTKELSNFALAGWRDGWTRRGFQNRKMGSRKNAKGSCKLTNQSLTRVGFRKI